MVGHGDAPVSALRVGHPAVFVAVHPLRGNVAVYELPENPGGRAEAVQVSDNPAGKGEGSPCLARAHPCDIAAVHLAHPEILAVPCRKLAQFRPPASQVGVRVDPPDGIPGFRRELFKRFYLHIDARLVRSTQDYVGKPVTGEGLLHREQHPGLAFSRLKVAALLLLAHRAPVGGGRFVHRINALE